LPEIVIDAMRPNDIENPKGQILSQHDLVILSSWSSTTADMVQLAERLQGHEILMVGVTEKSFADMALIARKSAGVMPIYSGEEVTITGIKSTLCTLLCLDLLGAWFSCQTGRFERIEPVVNRLRDLAGCIERLLDDTTIRACCKQIAAAVATADAVAIVGDAEEFGLGGEIALKIEDAAWYTVGKWYCFEEILESDPGRWPPGRFAIVHATRTEHVAKALDVMGKLAGSGIGLAAVSSANPHGDRIRRLCRGRCPALPSMDNFRQAYVDLVFYYLLALEIGVACGHLEGSGPRNRSKSLTVARSRPRRIRSPAEEIERLERRCPVDTQTAAGRSNAPRPWEDDLTEEKEPRRALSALRRLLDPLRRGVFRPESVAADADDTRRLGRLLFDPQSEVNGVVIVPLDEATKTAVHDAVAIWRRLTHLSLQQRSVGPWLRHAADDTLVLFVASRSPQPDRMPEAPAPAGRASIGWLGPAKPDWPEAKTAGALQFVLPADGSACPEARIYAALNVLLAEAWRHQAPKKASIVLKHLATAADTVSALLSEERLLASMREAAVANAGYRSALFVSPFAGSGRVWQQWFDASGCLTMLHHVPGHCGHGPIVTIDGETDRKYVALEDRASMVARYGESEVADWEARFLEGRKVDDFLARPPTAASLRSRWPMFAGRWYLPVIRAGYNWRRDNLVFLDLTAQRHLPVMLDDLSLFAGRMARTILVAQEALVSDLGDNDLIKFSERIWLTTPQDGPVSELNLPFVLDAVGIVLAMVWKSTVG
jgi:hypothetical protein